MINLKYTGITQVVLELYCNTTGSTPIYLFEVTKVGSDDVIAFIADDTSNVPCRYQLFNIEVSSDKDYENAIVNLTSGEYDYTIYQIDTVSLTANKLIELQTGILIVEDNPNDTIYS